MYADFVLTQSYECQARSSMESPLRCPLPPDGQSSPKEEEEVGEEGEEGEDVEVLKNFFIYFICM